MKFKLHLTLIINALKIHDKTKEFEKNKLLYNSVTIIPLQACTISISEYQ